MPAGAFKDNFQEYPYNINFLQSGYYSTVPHIAAPVFMPTGVTDQIATCTFPVTTRMTTLNLSGVNEGPLYYVAFTLPEASWGMEVWFFRADGTQILGGGSVGISTPNARIELKKIGNTWKTYNNGFFMGNMLTTVEDAYYVLVYPYSSPVDNLVTGDSGTNPYVIGTVPAGWYVRKDMLSPLTKGLYNDTGSLISTFYHADWGVPSMDLGTYTITTKHLISGATINSTTWTAGLNNWSVGGLAGNVSYNIDDILVNSAAPYGIYEIRLTSPTIGLVDTDYLYYIATGADIEWDRETYSAGDDAVITTTVSAAYWDTANYDYEGRIYDLYGTLKDSWAITSDVDTETVSLVGYDTGDYVATIVATHTSGTEYWMDYDIATISAKATITGCCINAYTGSVVKAASVNMLQGGSWFNTSTDGTGIYNVTDLDYGLEIGINATKSGFNFTAFDFTPPAAATYHFNLSFIPNYVANHTALMGVVYEDWSHNIIPGATVYISNNTWTGTSTTASSSGFYKFDSLCAGQTYRINSTASGYDDSIDYSRSPISGLALVQNCEMTPSYVLGVECEDESSAPISGAYVSSSDGQAMTTGSTGRAQFTLGFGAYTITGTADGYYGDSEAIVMTGARNITLSFSPKTAASSGAGIAYPPHNVKFTVMTFFGQPISEANITAKGYQTTVGPWDWLKTLLGLPLDETPIHNQTMEGTTDTGGQIDFMMIESVKYR